MAIPLVAAVALTLASTGQIVRFNVLHLSFHVRIQSLVLVLCALLVYSVFATVVFAIIRRIGEGTATIALVVVTVAAVVQFIVFYHYLGPGRADADEALDILADSLSSHFNPYLRHTALHNTLSPMMGAGLIAAPFRLVCGHGAYQNPAILTVGVVACWRSLGPKVALAAAVLTLSCLGFIVDYSFGGDYYVGGVTSSLTAFALLSAIERKTQWRYPLAVLFGMAVTNRASTVVVLLLLIAVVTGAGLLRASIAPVLVAAVTSLAMWVPWWVTDPQVYAPLQRAHIAGPPLVRLAVLVAITVVLAAACLARRIPALSTVEPRTLLAICGTGLALTLLPIVTWNLYSIYRASPFLFFLVPLLAHVFRFRQPVRSSAAPVLVSEAAMHKVDDGR